MQSENPELAGVDLVIGIVLHNEPSAPDTPEASGGQPGGQTSKLSPFVRHKVEFSEDDLPAVPWPPHVDEVTAAECLNELQLAGNELAHHQLSEPELPGTQQHHRHRNSTKLSRHQHDSSSSSIADSSADSVMERRHSFSSGFDSSSVASSSGLSSNFSCPSEASSCTSSRPKSFTVGQLQAHKHRLAASTPARSCSPPGTSHDPCCSHNRRCNKCGPQRQRPAVSAPGLRLQGSGGSVCSYTHKPLAVTYSGGAYPDARLMSSSGGSLPLRGLLLAENVSVQDVGKGFESHWYSSNRVLQVFDGTRSADPQVLLKQVPQQPGLHLWLVKPPCSRQWVPVRLDAADNLQQALACCLHEDGSCGPPGSKQRVLLDLQCRGFAVQVRYRPLKHSCRSVQQDLLSKLQRYDFALNDTDNNGCRPIELPDGRPVFSYPLVVGHMMKLFEARFAQPKLL